MKKDNDGKKNLGDRVPEIVIDALRSISGVLKVPKQQLTEDAIMMWMGKDDPMAESRRRMALAAFRNGEVERPFNPPHSASEPHRDFFLQPA